MTIEALNERFYRRLRELGIVPPIGEVGPPPAPEGPATAAAA